MSEKRKLKIEFAPGCFDSFEGTQEELEEMQAEILRMFESGEFADHVQAVSIEDLEPEDRAAILQAMGTSERKLH